MVDRNVDSDRARSLVILRLLAEDVHQGATRGNEEDLIQSEMSEPRRGGGGGGEGEKEEVNERFWLARDKADWAEGHAHTSHAEFVGKMAFGDFIIDFISHLFSRVLDKRWFFGGLMAWYSDRAGKDLIE
jgi:hypothetical protein